MVDDEMVHELAHRRAGFGEYRREAAQGVPYGDDRRSLERLGEAARVAGKVSLDHRGRQYDRPVDGNVRVEGKEREVGLAASVDAFALKADDIHAVFPRAVANPRVYGEMVFLVEISNVYADSHERPAK